MRHEINIAGYGWGLRPVQTEDAAFIVSLRSNPALNAYIHASTGGVKEQVVWIERYLERGGDWYFIIINLKTGEADGTVGIYDYDAASGTAEWGRWIVRPGASAAVESAALVYRVAFERIGLKAVYCRTIVDNQAVVSFHDSSRAPRNAILREHFNLGDRLYDSVEHRVDLASWGLMRPRLDTLARRIARVEH